MKGQVDSRFMHEARTFAFAFTCESCASFDPEPAVCAYGYPTAPHRRVPLEPDAELIFCKTFEMA